MKRWLMVMGWLLVVATCQAGDQAYTLFPTELKADPFSDAPTLVTLPERAAVEVLQRWNSWMEVNSARTTGWVKMLSLQWAPNAVQRKADNGLRSLFNLAQTGRSGSTVTTGVRGLSEGVLKKVRPNPRELEVAKRYLVGKDEAQRFAVQGGLQSQQVNYLPSGAR